MPPSSPPGRGQDPGNPILRNGQKIKRCARLGGRKGPHVVGPAEGDARLVDNIPAVGRDHDGSTGRITEVEVNDLLAEFKPAADPHVDVSRLPCRFGPLVLK
jgi:hypothetical protein